ncbi:MAG: DUF748 domain-containing protein [Povalibacter sp.]
MLRRNRILLIVAIVVVLAVVIRAALPTLILDYTNRKLAALEGYHGHVDDVDLAIWRGAYVIDGLRVMKREGNNETPFIYLPRTDFSVEWRNLFKGAVVAEAKFIQPQINLIQSENKKEQQLGTEVNWQDQLKGLLPIRINTVTVQDGTITFRTPGIKESDALVAHHVSGTVSNLTNVVKDNRETFANFNMSANVLKDGAARVNGSVNPLAPTPTFDVNLAVERVKLPQVNPWLRQYLKADAAKGDFQLYLEVAAADGKFKGYAKPLMQNVDMHGMEDENKPALKKMWEGLVDFGAKIFENDDKEQVAARVPFSGTIENPKTSILDAIVSVLQNAFVGAFANSLEGSISLRDVKGELGRYQLAEGKKGDSDKDKKSDKKDKQSKEDDKKKASHGPRSTT